MESVNQGAIIMICLENDWVAISVNEANGSIIGLYDKRKNQDYMIQGHESAPFRIESSIGISSEFESFSYERDMTDSTQLAWKLTWVIKQGLQLNSRICVHSDMNEIRFYSEVDNQTEDKIISLEYPIIPDLSTITEQGDNDYIAHSFATGFQIRNPMKHFETNGLGLRHMPYPEGFSGSTMQFFTYYGLNQGGLYFAALDGQGYAKWLNFYKNDHGLLEASFIHGCEDIGAYKGINSNYPIVVQLLDGRDWYEAAHIYRAWAEQQNWCAKGKMVGVHDEDKSTWLLEDMGLATFGINAGYDRTRWLDEYHHYIHTPIFHILGPDWVHKKQNFYNGVPGGMDDWFPTRFNPATLEGIKKHGDKYAPFEFDYLFDVNGADGERGRKALQKFPDPIKSIDAYKFSLVCPADPYIRELHTIRDETLQRNDNVDSIYYDISANNILKVCTDETHGHPVGAGKAITDAYRDNYIQTKAAMNKQAGRYIPMGTEMMNEVFLDVLDYYQSRAGGQPAAMLEGWNIRSLLVSGDAELIPMFTYVYHEYGAVRIDGWGKLVEEIGSLYYFTVARTYLWGGLYELNYEYSPMEAIDGVENRAEEHYYIFEPRGYAFSAERASYLGRFAALRTGVANKYWAYGRMLRPLEFVRERIELDWYHYNCGKDAKEYEDSGVLCVDTVIHTAWQYLDESIGLFFANVTDVEHSIMLNLLEGQFDLLVSQYRITYLNIDLNIAGNPFNGSDDISTELELTIPKKSVVLLELFS